MIIYDDDYDDYDDYCGEIADWYYDAALEQETKKINYFYSGDLLISEIIKQEERMFCLASYFMLIADIDCGDYIEPSLKKLTNFVNDNGGSFRVYKTKNGMRYFQTDLLYQGANKSAIETLKVLGSDEKYIKLCSLGKRFMARLTPKTEPDLALKYFDDITNGLVPQISICHFLKTIGTNEIAPCFTQSIETHDLFCQSNENFNLF